MKLRRLLDKVGKIPGMMSEEKGKSVWKTPYKPPSPCEDLTISCNQPLQKDWMTSEISNQKECYKIYSVVKQVISTSFCSKWFDWLTGKSENQISSDLPSLWWIE